MANATHFESKRLLQCSFVVRVTRALSASMTFLNKVQSKRWYTEHHVAFVWQLLYNKKLKRDLPGSRSLIEIFRRHLGLE